MPAGAGRALGLLLALSTPAAAEDGAAWLQRMAAALSGLDYSGTFVYVRDGQVDALRVLHRADPHGAHERLTTLSGEPRELVRRGGQARLLGGIAAPVAAPDVAATADAADWQPHYQVVLAGRDRVAGQASRIVEIRPRDGFRYGYRLWLEEASALPLKSIAYGSDGVAVEQWMFTEIAIGRRPDDAELGTMESDRSPAADPGPGAQSWQVLDVPRGYRLRRRAALPDGGEQQVYGDGLASVSVYVEPLAATDANLSGLLRRGALSMFGRVVGGQQVTVVGAVPAATVERFAQGVAALDGR